LFTKDYFRTGFLRDKIGKAPEGKKLPPGLSYWNFQQISSHYFLQGGGAGC
jgi:hypothetical protein